MVLPDMSLEIVPSVGFILAFSAVETIRVRRILNVYQLSSFSRVWVLPDWMTLFLDNLLARLDTQQTGVRSEMLGELVSPGVGTVAAQTGEHGVEMTGELVALQSLHRGSFILTGLTGQDLPPLRLMKKEMFLQSYHGLTFPLAAGASLLVRNIVLDMKEKLGQILGLIRTTVADMKDTILLLLLFQRLWKASGHDVRDLLQRGERVKQREV